MPSACYSLSKSEVPPHDGVAHGQVLDKVRQESRRYLYYYSVLLGLLSFHISEGTILEPLSSGKSVHRHLCHT
jgi:hypothetical protein